MIYFRVALLYVQAVISVYKFFARATESSFIFTKIETANTNLTLINELMLTLTLDSTLDELLFLFRAYLC